MSDSRPNPKPTPPPASPLHPLSLLAKEVEARGLVASVDRSVSVVDVFAPVRPGEEGGYACLGGTGVSARSGVALVGADPAHQRVILRPDAVTAHPWWWLLWPGERFEHEMAEPEVTCLLPVECVEEVARRVRNILILDRNE